MAARLPESGREALSGQNVSRETFSRLETYVAVLLNWQKRINLIGPSTIEQVWTRHVADALQLIPLLPPHTKTLGDLGSGAGIPGLVLAIATGHHVHLYESNARKAAFLREAIRQTGASATIHHGRIEALMREQPRPRVDVILARAVAPLVKLLEYAAPFLEDGAIGLFHKGQDVDMELTSATKCWIIVAVKHPSTIDPSGVMLEVREATRVKS